MDEELTRTAGPGGAAAVRTGLNRTVHAVMARGQIEALYQAYLGHAASLGPLPDELALALLRRGLGAAVLQLALLPPDQFVSWTFNIAGPALVVFLAGDNSEFQITGRVYSEGVKVGAGSRLFVETQRPRHRPARSVVDFEGPDVLEACRHYYRRALQLRARLFELGESDFLLVQGLPTVNEEWLAGLDETSASEAFETWAEPIEQRQYRFRCGCDAERIRLTVHELFAGRLDELFGAEREVEVQCPRCGQGWCLSRDSLEGGQA